MKELLGKLLGLFRHKPLPKPANLRLLEDGFQVLQGSDVAAKVLWADVQKIVTFKYDLFTIDEIRVAFYLVSEQGIEISEKWQGFIQVVEEMKRRFPSIPGDWYNSVMVPAFVSNETVLYEAD